MRTAAVLCLLAVLGGLAGCVGPGAGGTPTPDPTPVDAGDVATPEPTPTPDPDPARATAVAASNPWNADPVTVGVVAPADDNRTYRPLVERALAFWENESTGYELDYRVVDDADAADADVWVRFVDNITRCSGTHSERDVGCADYVPRGTTAPDPTVVRVETGYTNDSTVETLKHEVGHTLGYEHDDTDEYAFMASETRKVRLPTPNATSLANPWKADSLRVYAAYPDIMETQRLEYVEGVERAVDYYRTDEASTLPAGVDLRLTDNRSEADIVVEFTRTGTATSVGRRYGYNEDADPAFERFTRYEITVNNIDRDRIGWHVGYWLGWAFGAESRADLPPPFDEPDEDDREDW